MIRPRIDDPREAGSRRRARSRAHLGAACSAIAVTFLASGVASANGRFPAAGQLVVDPSDPQHLVLRATFGILETSDGGTNWGWICEKAVGYTGVEDPAMGVTSDGSILAGIFEGLSISHDRGCSWDFAKGPTDGQYTIDVAVEKQDPKRAVAITSTGVSGGFHVVLAETTDDGKTWAQAGADLPSDFLAQTVDVSPADAQRVYASGLAGPEYAGAVERSDDHGATWTRLPFDIGNNAGAYIAGVDPTDADRLYLRLDGEPGDALWMSTDGATTWKPIYASTSDMLGFALSPDGKKIAAGGPKDGLWIASTSDLVFEQVSTVDVKCLAWSDAGLYACGDEFVDGFTIGVSKDDGKTFSPVYHLSHLGILSCPAGTPQADICPDEWTNVASTIGADGSTSAGAGGAGATSSSSSAASGSGGSSGSDDDGGCSTSRGSGAPAGTFLLGLAGVGVAWSLRRRR
jgi:MYXO-CTERM domain-containing protein